MPAPSCDSPEDCAAAGFEGVCRQGTCHRRAPCTDDVECGLGEHCRLGDCRFDGCTQDSECPTGRCRRDVFACTECATRSDCRPDRPVCDADAGQCVGCLSDSDCPSRGAGYCDPAARRCVHCRENAHCPPGLSCGPDRQCHGAAKNESCANGVACDLGLMCVNVGSTPLCLQGCSLYDVTCPPAEICLKLTFSGSTAVVFENGAPRGVCYAPMSGLKGYREPCTQCRTETQLCDEPAQCCSGNCQGGKCQGGAGSATHCQGNLQCVADSATSGACRGFCDPAQPSCPTGERCHAFAGDYSGHEYGLCYADNGLGDRCGKDSQCRAGLACAPGDDPSVYGSVGTFCRFSAGAGDRLAACSANAGCKSGMCRADPVLGGAPFFCFGACEQDADCLVLGRQGSCDADFSVSGPFSTGSVRGCRPRCDASSACSAYGAAMSCRVRVFVTNDEPKAVLACGPRVGSAGALASCTSGADCASGHCALADARGISRRGTCLEPCATSADCTLADGGSAGSCGSLALLAGLGYDGQPNTADDRHVAVRACARPPCAQDADCGPQERCAPEPSAAAPLSTLELRCAPPSATGSLEGGAACQSDSECFSGACGYHVTTGARACLAPCTPATACPAGTTCQAGAVRLLSPGGAWQTFAGCLP